MGEKNKVMIVDDEKSNLLYLNHLLSAEYTVYSVRDAREAVERAIEYQPDLILLDIIMPELSGYEVLAALKEAEITKDIPVIFITGLSGIEDEMKGMYLGAKDYITKPFNDTIVSLRVRNQIKIERMSIKDELLEIANRRGFYQRIDMEWRMAVRAQVPVSLLMIDIDGLISRSKPYGHQQIKAVLQTVSDVLKNSLMRSTDFAARLNNDVFAVLLPATDENGAFSIAEKIRAAVRNTAVFFADGTTASVTVCIGLHTQTPFKDDAMANFISDAYNALNAAKEIGTDSICKAS